MNTKRIDILKALAQSTTTPVVPANTPPPTIDIRAIPKFNSNLFATYPIIINDLNLLVNKLSMYMNKLNNKVNFSIVYTSPSITGSEYTNSLKNLLNLSKWLYNQILTVNRPPYTMPELTKIFADIINTVSQYSFPEPSMANAQNDLTTIARVASAKLGGK